MSPIGAAPRAAVPVSNTRAEASRRNGAKSRGPKTPEGKARAAQNALKHGLRAEKHVVLPDEDAAGFKALEAALFEELAPEGVLQGILVRRVVCATWRLERAERLEAEMFATHRYADASAGCALVRDGHGARSFATLLRYRGAAEAELWRALRALKALQAEQAAEDGAALEERPKRRAARPPLIHRPQPDEPQRGAGRRPGYVSTEPPAPRAPNEPGPLAAGVPAPARPDRAPNEPEPHRVPRPDHERATPPPAQAATAIRGTAYATS